MGQRKDDEIVLLIYYNDVIMGTTASQITSLALVYLAVYSGADKKKTHQSSASLAFVRGIHRGPVNSIHKWPVMRKMVPFDGVIMTFMHILDTYLIASENRKTTSCQYELTVPVSAVMADQHRALTTKRSFRL